MPKKESSVDKVRAWERDRRERLNVCFKNLASLLPNYDPSAKLSKHEILERAAAYIRDLQENYRALLQFRLDETESSEVRLLKDHVAELVKRVQQLAKLLQDASIPVPPYLPLDSTLTSLTHTHRWSSKLKPEDTLLLYERVQKLKAEKAAAQSKKARTEVKKKVHKLNKVQVVKTVNTTAAVVNTSKVTTKKSVSSTSAVPSNLLKKAKMCKKSKTVKSSKVTQKVFGDKLPTVAQLLGLSITEIETSPAVSIVSTVATQESPAVTSTLFSTGTTQIPGGFIVIQGNNGIQQTSVVSPSRTLQQQCFVTKNAAAANTNGLQPMSLIVGNGKKTATKKKKQSSIAVTKSHLLTAPVITGGIQTCAPTAMIANPAGLGPGTLILANGNIVPVLPPPPAVLAAPTQIIVNSNPLPTAAPANATPVIMMQQQKNAFTLVTTANTSSMTTVTTSKPQQRSFPLLVPKKKQDNTKTTFANKVPIPALSTKHQPLKQASSQSPSTIQLSAKVSKARNKLEPENAKNVGNLPSVEKAKSTSQTSKKSKALKVKETLKETNAKCSVSLEETKGMNVGRSSPKSNASETENAIVSLELETVNNEAHEDLEEPNKSYQKDDSLAFNVNEVLTVEPNVEKTNEKNDHSKQVIFDETKGKNNSINEDLNNTLKRKAANENEEDPISQKKLKYHTQEQRSCNSLTNRSDDSSSQVPEPELDQTLSTAVVVFKPSTSGIYTIDALCNSKEDIPKNSGETGIEDVTTPSSSTSVNVPQQTPSQQLHLESKGKDTVIIMDVVEDVPVETQANVTVRVEQAENLESLTDSNSKDDASNTVKSDTVHKNHSDLTDSTTLPKDTSQNSSTSNLEANASHENQCSSEVVYTSNSPQYSTATHDGGHVSVSLPSNSVQNSVTLLDHATSLPYSSSSLSDIKSEAHRSLQPLQIFQYSDEKGKADAEMPEKDTEIPSISTTNALSSEIPQTAKEMEQNTASVQTNIEKPEQNDQQSSLSEQIVPSVLPELGISSIQHTTSTTTVSTSHCSEHSFVPISNIPEMDASPRTSDSETNLNTSLNISLSNPEFSNDLFASLQVPSGNQHPESISPTAAFLLAFPLVSSSKVTEMIADSQEETGCDSIQETSTLLQIGNIEQETSEKEPDLQIGNETMKGEEMYNSKAQSKSDSSPSGNLPTVAEEQMLCATTSNSDMKTVERGLQMTNVQDEKSDHSAEGRKIQEKSSAETSLSPNALKLGENQCSSNENTETQSTEEPTNIPKTNNRSVGTQLNLFDSIHLKASEAASVQVSLPSGQVETSMYVLPELSNSNKESVTSSKNYTQEAVTCSSTMLDVPVSTVQSKASGYCHQQCHLSSALFHPLKTFEASTQKSVSNTDLSEILSLTSGNTSNKYTVQLQNAMDDAVMKLTHAVNTQVPNVSEAYKFTSNRGSKPTHLNATSANETVNESSIAKIQTEGKLQDDKTQSNTTVSVYKAVRNTDFQKVNFSNHTTTSVTTESQERSDSFNEQSPTQSYSYSFDYSQNDTEQNKLKPSSFSLAHSSSNCGILSWTTLSPVSTVANISHCEHLSSTSAQNAPVTTGHNAMTSSNSLGHKQPDTNRILNNDRINTIATSSARMHKTLQNTCHKQGKNESSTESNANDQMQKMNFTDQYIADGRQIHRDVEDSHIHCHQVKNQMLGTQDEGRNNENFKFLHSMSSEGKECQSSSSRVKQSQQNSQHHRPPVNWMTAPDIRSGSMPCSNMTTVPSSTVTCLTSSTTIPTTAATVASSSHINKDLDFGNSRCNHNLFLNTSSASSSNFDSRMLSSNHSFYGSSMLSSHNNFYATSHQPSHIIPKEDNTSHSRGTQPNPAHRLPELPLQGQNHHNETYSLAWESKKVPYSSSSTIFGDLNASNFVPTTLPTLVGDLALGTPYPVSSGVNDDHGHSKSFGHSDFNDGDVNKKDVLDIQRHDVLLKQFPSSRHLEKQQTSDKGNGNRICAQEYRGATETSGGGTSGNFLSVSQLVDHVKSSRPQVNVGQRKGTTSRQTLGGSNKQSLNNSRQHAAVSESTTITSRRAEKDSTKKSQQQINTNSITYNTATAVPSSTENKPSSVPSSRSNNLYPNEPSSSIATAISQNNAVFAMGIRGIGTHSTAPVSSSLHSWSTNRVKSSGTSASTSTYKAPVSSYSAEALIGSSSTVQSESISHLPHEGPNSKMITLPPPMVTERFRHGQNYHHHPPPLSQSSRSLQVAVSFGNDTIIPGNYFPSVELQNSHQSSNSNLLQGNCHHENFSQNQHTYGNASFSYSQTGANNMASQNGTGLYPGANFAPDPVANRNPSTSVSVPAGFLPGSSSFPGAVVPSDISSSISFPPPPPIMKSITSNCSSSTQQNLTYINATTSTSSQHHHHNSQQISSQNDSGNRSNTMANAASTNQTSRRNQASQHQSSSVNSSSSSCSATKQRASRRRAQESLTSVSGNASTGLAGLVDLGYLPMPPGIGSPLLGADDGTFLSHHAGSTFLAPPPPPGPQLYPAGPPPPVSQAPLYPPPPPTRSQSQQNMHHSGSHLAGFSCSSAMQNRTSHHQQQLHHHHHHHQPQNNASPSAGGSSGNSLANFNLSTIFPEINDKQVSSVSSVAAFSGTVSSKALAAIPPPAPPPPPPPPSSSSLLSNNSHQHNPLLASSGNEADFSRRLAPPPTPVPSNCLPPVPLPTNFNNILSHAPPPPQEATSAM